MAKMTMNELRFMIADILEEAKKSKKSSSKKAPPQVEAFGFHDEVHDFSRPLGAHNLYRQQGGVNWGPYTSGSPDLASDVGNPNGGSAASHMRESEEQALRAIVREVIENGLIDESSAWSPFIEKSEPIFESTWDEVAFRLNEAWYDDFRKPGKDHKDEEPKKQGKGYDKTEFGSVKKHGQEKKGKK